jgi:Pvc16 N-terminal domain/IPT/TIG domain
MSNALAVAATMRVIASLLDSGVNGASLASLFGSALTTVHPPDLVPIGDNVETDHLNLFLYTVTMNSGWRNIATVRDPAGDRVGRPPLAVDLHFLLSAYGAAQYHPELLLGIGMQVLHEQPFLDRNGIRTLFGMAGSPEDQAMATAELDQQIEQIKISPHDLSADELYKLWSAFGSKCRPSAAYVATVVLIDSKAQVQSAKPVMLPPNIGVVTFERPVISDVTPDTFNLSVPVQLTLTGSGFQLPGTFAQFGTGTVPFDSVGPTSARVTVPSTVVPGMNMLKVVRTYAIGQPPDKLIGDSSPVGILVQPFITNVTTPVVAGVQRINVAFVPSATTDQPASLLLDQINPPPGATPNRYAIDALPQDIAGASIWFDASTVASGTYLLRVEISGTESVPTFDPNAGFTGPTVTL